MLSLNNNDLRLIEGAAPICANSLRALNERSQAALAGGACSLDRTASVDDREHKAAQGTAMWW
jgi:hypothetical protein